MRQMIWELMLSRLTLWIRFGSSTPAGTSEQGGSGGRKGEREKKKTFSHNAPAKC